jgi:CelD/BcsL family acetyltransferase involved in cellulose biosynthesis
MSCSAVLGAEGDALAGDDSYLSIRVEDPLKHSAAEWEALLPQDCRSGFFHGAAWASVLAATYGFQPFYFVASRGGRVESVLPAMEVDSWLTGKRGVSLPFTDFCEPAGSAPDAMDAVIRAALRHGREREWKYFELRGFPAGCRMLQGARPSVSYYAHELKLFPDTEFLFSRCESSVRRAIRKAQRSGLTVEISQDLAALRDYYALHCKTRKQHGLPPQPLAFFLNIHKFVLSQNLGMIVTAKSGGHPVASAVYFQSRRETIYKFGASDPSCLELRANNLVMWEAIQWCARNGKAALNFGRTSRHNDGLRRYKLGWGATEREMQYYRQDLRTNAFVQARDEASGWHNRVFRSLPVCVGRGAGALLYKHMA